MANKNIVQLAKEFVVKIGGVIVARCTDFSFSINRETIDITSFDSEKFVEKVGDRLDWSIGFGSLVTRLIASNEPGYGMGHSATAGLFPDLLAHMLDATAGADYPVTVALDFKGNTGTSYIEGPGLLVGLDVDGSDGDKATYSGSIEGAGKLKQA